MTTRNFSSWMKDVDAALVRKCGLTHRDLADCCYRDMFDDEVDPEEAADEVLAENDFPFDDDEPSYYKPEAAVLYDGTPGSGSIRGR